MYFEEHIDRLKQNFSSKDFNVPFTQGSSILKSIEKRFITTKDLAKDLNNLRQYFSSWAENIKHKTEIKSVNLDNYSSWLDKLEPGKNYWTIIAFDSSAKNLVYDCKPNALIALVSIRVSDFFVVDKKYEWFSYFQVDPQSQRATIFRSGQELTPFDK